MPRPPKLDQVRITNPDKIFFPDNGFTKADVIRYYVEVSKYLLPHIKGRPITLIRFPDGVSGERFYAKNTPKFAPDWIDTFDVSRRHREGAVSYTLINNVQTLAWCANIAGLELHPFLHRAPKIDLPTHVVFDLDPGEGTDLNTCARVALEIKAVLDKLGLESLPKVSGSKGLQLYVPLNTKVTYEATSAFAHGMAKMLEGEMPDAVTSEMSKETRKGKVMIDWSQNNQSKTTVAVYSLRGKRTRPYVSMPLKWTEVRSLARGSDKTKFDFTPDKALARLKRIGDLFAPLLTLKQKLPKEFKTPAVAKAAKDSLADYRAKRDFTKTKEPKAKANTRIRNSDTGRFVIQKHAASHLHYDFRLEMEGTLKSWAVPKGLSSDVEVKRAAFEVEDHPLDYMKFEGTIPKGEYGGGTVMVWDLGTYQLLGGSHESGDLKLNLAGKKLKGEWHLFRIKSDSAKPMWLIKRSGKNARAIGAKRDDESVLTGRTMDQIATGKSKVWSSKRK